MTRALLALAACAVVAVWLLRRGPSAAPRGVLAKPEQSDPMDGVQWDPWTREVRAAWDMQTVLPALPPPDPCLMGTEYGPRCDHDHDAPYIDNPVLVRMRDAYRGSTQGGM